MLIPVVIAVAIVIFTLMYFVPGDPAEIILGSQVTQEQKDEVRKPVPEPPSKDTWEKHPDPTDPSWQFELLKKQQNA